VPARVSTGNEGVVGIKGPGAHAGREARRRASQVHSLPFAGGRILVLTIRELVELRTLAIASRSRPMTAIAPIFFMRPRRARDRDAWIL